MIWKNAILWTHFVTPHWNQTQHDQTKWISYYKKEKYEQSGDFQHSNTCCSTSLFSEQAWQPVGNVLAEGWNLNRSQVLSQWPSNLFAWQTWKRASVRLQVGWAYLTKCAGRECASVFLVNGEMWKGATVAPVTVYVAFEEIGSMHKTWEHASVGLLSCVGWGIPERIS